MTRDSAMCRWRVLLALVVVLAVVMTSTPAHAQSGDEEADLEQELAERWAPVYLLKAQEAECDADGEQYEPTSVEIVLDNDEIALRQVSPGDPVVGFGPSAADLYGLGETFYLEYPGLSLSPGCNYERDFKRYRDDQPAVVYAHVVREAGHLDQLAVQYWTFWYYNDWNNKHETDWEFTQLLFDAASVSEALTVGPARVGYAQHEGGERAEWDDDKVEKIDGRPVVYPSAGSHASYYSSAVYLGRSGSEGFGCDNTDGPSRRVDAEVVLLPDAPTGPDDPFAWLAFEGRWGERHDGPFNGPTGPAAKPRYLEPVSWHEDLRSDSVIIPAGESLSSSIVTGFCDVVEWGSGLLIQYLSDPLQVLITVLVAVGVGLFLIRRTSWAPRDPAPLRAPRRAGQVLGAASVAYRRRPGTFIAIGLAFLPLTLFTALVLGLISQLAGVSALIVLVDENSSLGALLAFLVGGLANVIGATFVQAAVCVTMNAADEGRTVDARAAYAAVLSRWKPLCGAIVRTVILVGLLLITVIGVPIGIWLLVRYQFLAQAVMLDGTDGRGALRRSARLVEGRWLHTAVMVLLINGVVAISAFVVGFLVLVLVSGLPLWGFNIVTAGVYALLVPLAAAAYTLLYGDRVAATAAEADEPVAV
ncbi:MAG: hypothetical protein ACR2QE_21305 [Acidimicrobiales bacterium]